MTHRLIEMLLPDIRCLCHPHRLVPMQTAFGGTRMVDWLAGEQLPRIF